MKMPMLDQPKRRAETVSVFGGYDARDRRGTEGFSEVENLSSSAYPALSPRSRRGTVDTALGDGDTVAAISVGERLCYVHGSCFIADDNPTYSGGGETHTRIVDLGLQGTPDTRIVMMGSYAVIFPDRKYVSLSDMTDNGSIDAEKTSSSATICPCPLGEPDAVIIISAASPEASCDYWLDTSGGTDILRFRSGGEWQEVQAAGVRITVGGSIPFSEGDGVSITASDALCGGLLPDSAVIASVGTGSVVIPGSIDKHAEKAAVKLSRKMPKCDIVFECGNRLWGCRSGTDEGGRQVNCIYASALGDFRNWNVFEGLSTDSYALTVGSGGEFTGAAAYMGYPHFFTENAIHKVYGEYPSLYSLRSLTCPGVQKDCGDSVAAAGGILYYKSRRGIYAYDGSLPTFVGDALGTDVYDCAVGGALGEKYYVSMRGSNGRYSLFVYDSRKRLWHREDNTAVRQFASIEGELYYTERNNKAVIRSVGGSGITDSEPVRWYAVSGAISGSMGEHEYLSRLILRIAADQGASVGISVRYDSRGEWQELGTVGADEPRSITLPILPRRCDHLHLRLSGRGYARITMLTMISERGSIY